jgi:hypothetical protein
MPASPTAGLKDKLLETKKESRDAKRKLTAAHKKEEESVKKIRALQLQLAAKSTFMATPVPLPSASNAVTSPATSAPVDLSPQPGQMRAPPLHLQAAGFEMPDMMPQQTPINLMRLLFQQQQQQQRDCLSRQDQQQHQLAVQQQQHQESISFARAQNDMTRTAHASAMEMSRHSLSATLSSQAQQHEQYLQTSQQQHQQQMEAQRNFQQQLTLMMLAKGAGN